MLEKCLHLYKIQYKQAYMVVSILSAQKYMKKENRTYYFNLTYRQIFSTIQNTPPVIIGFMALFCNYQCEMFFVCFFFDETAVSLDYCKTRL